MKTLSLRLPAALALGCGAAAALAADAPPWREAEANARLASEAFGRAHRYLHGWLAHADPVSGLIPRNLRAGDRWQGVPSRDLWNGRDAAADNYPFLVLTASLNDRALFEGRMREMLRTETRLTRRVGGLSDNYRFSTRSFVTAEPVLDEIMFDNAEYAKDGLLPLLEYLGPSPWSERLIGLVDAIWEHAPVATPFGKIPTTDVEVTGDLLQVCSRLYWHTGERKYLDRAIRLGDWWLLGDRHPTRRWPELKLNDHGGEVVNGLAELYFALGYADPAKQAQYRPHLREIFDTLLAVARNADGLLHARIDGPGRRVTRPQLIDTWGYIYDGVYTLWLTDRVPAYRDAVRHVLSRVHRYTGAPWADVSVDGYADSIEGALNLHNREPDASAAAWIERQTAEMGSKQQADGTFEGWHGDGNVARTLLMVALWKTQGVTLQPWRADVQLGATISDGELFLQVTAAEPWTGRIVFDRPRHRDFLRLPIDYPRINQFPEWFVADSGRAYLRRDHTTGATVRHEGIVLLSGLAAEVRPGVPLRWSLRREGLEVR